MANVNINEILGSDSISGSRITINSNFLILQNWINGFESVFGINTSTGVLNLSGAAAGQIIAKVGKFDTINLPSATAPTITLTNGGGSFVSLSTATFSVSGISTFNGAVVYNNNFSQAAGTTGSFAGAVGYSGRTTYSSGYNEVHGNNWSTSGSLGGGQAGLTSAFPVNTSGIGGGGIVTAVNSPYVLTGTEDVIYANCGPTGFFLKMVDGNGATASSIPAGYRLTIVNTSAAAGTIFTGVTGTTSTYYTGFNTTSTYGGYSSTGVTFPTSKAYRSSVTLQWEPRIAGDQASQKGSWVVISSNNASL